MILLHTFALCEFTAILQNSKYINMSMFINTEMFESSKQVQIFQRDIYTCGINITNH